MNNPLSSFINETLEKSLHNNVKDNFINSAFNILEHSLFAYGNGIERFTLPDGTFSFRYDNYENFPDMKAQNDKTFEIFSKLLTTVERVTDSDEEKERTETISVYARERIAEVENMRMLHINSSDDLIDTDYNVGLFVKHAITSNYSEIAKLSRKTHPEWIKAIRIMLSKMPISDLITNRGRIVEFADKRSSKFSLELFDEAISSKASA